MPAIYTEADYTAISAQHKKRWLALAIPCVLLLAVLIYSLCVRIEWLTSVSTILIGVILIAGYDFAIKPIFCYQRHLNHCLHGRTRDCELPFIRLSENIDVVDGVRFRQLLCADVDGKNRPYERLFYFDAEKEFPAVKEGDMLHIDHYELAVANVYPV
ncbi:MAG: hypothetical protein IJA83_07720 [Clostridia bacterium]|nr:hypothetical protein [Clostridia bacterium]